MSAARLATALLLAVALVRAAAADLPVARWQGRTMGSPYQVQIVGTNFSPHQLEVIRGEIERRLAEVNRQMSHYQPDSELSRFNAAPADVPFRVSAEFARVTRFALALSERAGGAFDPTLAPLVNLWGFGEKSNAPEVPPTAAIQAALAQVGWRHIKVTAGNELLKDRLDLALNLSAVAKGFGVDEMGRVLRDHGLTNFWVSIAGEVLVSGVSSRGTSWLVGITAPTEHWREGDPMAAGVALSNRAISTSGDYQKFFRDAAGRRFSHLLDPRTGQPVQHDVGGVSVIAEDSMTADALATTVFVLGPEEGLRFIEDWPKAAAIFLVREPGGRLRKIVSSRFPPLIEPER